MRLCLVDSDVLQQCIKSTLIIKIISYKKFKRNKKINILEVIERKYKIFYSKQRNKAVQYNYKMINIEIEITENFHTNKKID